MKDRVILGGLVSMVALVLFPSAGLSQAEVVQNRIAQPIVVNGQTASGAYVMTPSGQIQSYTCPTPQRFATADGSSQGWACYEQNTGTWLLSALPPQDQATPVPAPARQPAAPPPVIYRQAPPVFTQPAVVVYQTAPAVVYQQPPVIVYERRAPEVVYAPAPTAVVVAPAYPPSVILGRAAIEAAGRIASAVIVSSHHTEYYGRGVDRDHGRR